MDSTTRTTTIANFCCLETIIFVSASRFDDVPDHRNESSYELVKVVPISEPNKKGSTKYLTKKHDSLIAVSLKETIKVGDSALLIY
jgi:hypothetical protein